MKTYNKKDIVAKRYDNKVIAAVYYGTILIWQAIRSCFGAGYWRGDKPWDGSDAWKG